MTNNKDESVIPPGVYCHFNADIIESDDPSKPPQVKWKMCPYHSFREPIPGSERDQEALYMEGQTLIGCCAFLEKDDADFQEEGWMGLLSDSCKECGINMDED